MLKTNCKFEALDVKKEVIKLIDLHIHTTNSDGTDTPIQILKLAEEKGLKYISITDHDTCKSYYDLKEVNISEYYSGKVINGVELKCIYKGRNIDVLGYKFDLDKMNNWLKEFYKEKTRIKTQTKYFDILYNVCEKLNLTISKKEDIVWNPEFDWASVTIYHELEKYKEENKDKLPEDIWESFTVFSKKYCADKNGPWYIDKSKDYPSIEEGIRAIKDAGGLVFMPHLFIYKWAKDKEEFINDIIDNYDIDGIECYHSQFDESNIEYMLKITEEKNLLRSGGTDYHGKNKPGLEFATGFNNFLHIDEKIIENWVE